MKAPFPFELDCGRSPFAFFNASVVDATGILLTCLACNIVSALGIEDFLQCL